MAALGSLNSTTMESGLLEIIESLTDLQSDTAINPDGKQMVTGYSRDGLTGEISVTLSIPSTASPDAQGKPVIFATQIF